MAKADKIAEFEDRIAKLESDLKALKDDLAAFKNEVETEPAVPVKSQAREQSGSFPFPVGKVVKVAFPELFRRKLINAGDVAYLLSEQASKDFKTRGYSILRVYTTDDDPGLYACDHRRFYRMKPLELGSKRYHLSSQFYPESRQAVLKWIYAHGIKKNELLALLEE